MQKFAADDPGEIILSYHRGVKVSSIAARYHINRERLDLSLNGLEEWKRFVLDLA